MEVINDFNDTFMFMIKDIANVCPKSMVGTHQKDIEKLAKNKEKPTLLIDMFVMKVLKYKNEIKERKDTFFLSKSYDDDVESNAFLLHKILEFKSIWVDLKHENREIVFDYMNILCDLADAYLLTVFKK